MRDDLKPFMKDAVGEAPALNKDVSQRAMALADRYKSFYKKINPAMFPAAQHAAEAHSKLNELSQMVDRITSLEDQSERITQLMAESEQRRAEASGRYLAEYFDAKWAEYDKKLEKAEKAARRNLVLGFVLGIIGAIVANVLTPYVAHLLSQ